MSTPPVNSCNSSAGLIEKYINSAYDNVKAVADNLDYLDQIYQFLLQYGLITNIAIKAPVQAVATSPITLSGNQVLTWSAHSGDYSVFATTGMRVLVLAQTNPVENGIYDVKNNAWTRSVDFDGPKDVVDGTLVFSSQGDVWQVDGPQYSLVPGTDPIIFKDIDLFAYEALREATEKAQEAAASAAAALASEQAAKVSENSAASSETNASNSAAAAAISETNAKVSENAAKVSENNAKASQVAAQNSASLAESVTNNTLTFATTAAGIAGTTNGQYFRVPQGSGATLSFIYYLNSSGTAQVVAEMPGKGAITNNIRSYSSLAVAQADVTAGNILNSGYCYVRSTEDSTLVNEYQNQSGTLVATGKSIPSNEAYDQLTDDVAGALEDIEQINKTMVLKDIVQTIFNYRDKLGYRLFYALTDGEFGTKFTTIKRNGVYLKDLTVAVDSDGSDVYIQNKLGQRVYIIKDGVVAPGSLKVDEDGAFGTDAAHLSSKGISFLSGSAKVEVTDGPEFLKVSDKLGRVKTIIDHNGKLASDVIPEDTASTHLDNLNSYNLNYYSKVRSEYNADIERAVFALSWILVYGQSLSTSQEGFPALSKEVYSNLSNLMLGDSSRPNSRTAANFVPVGSPVLNPLKAVVQTSSGNAIMSDSAVAALAAGSPNEGEGAEGCVNMFRSMFLRQLGLLKDDTRRLVLSNCGVNGRTIEALSKGASPELYNRVREAYTQIKAIADSGNMSFGLAAICFLQGEWNYTTAYGGNNTREGYKVLQRQLKEDLISDFAQNQYPPAMYTYQTSGAYTSDANELAIGMAQLDLALEKTGTYGVTPSYPFPDKGGHLTSNGYRWMWMHFAKVMFRTLVLGQGWEPLHCISAETSKNISYLNYAVPYPPLKWGKPYVGRTATDYTNKGYRATDDAGTLPISSVEIVRDTVVKITYSRNAVGTVKIWYADKTTHNGNGCLMDSDPFIATENYVYVEGSGQYADENIAELVDKPYPLNNWAWAQVIYSTVNGE
ncbi:tail fiber protein [Klebsiella phage KpCHEMY26]|uniref:Tail fiber protein n=1 Tax=Klebsiella phage KpCHEMY26 TaxID=2596966 RepID=A0A5B8R5Y0_9CAUD|nr:tail fiber protein [Klebsiella phage KpCHEMY26]QEA03296.1 tail fiber protein [Klebsiella phage KpCHEMY26]